MENGPICTLTSVLAMEMVSNKKNKTINSSNKNKRARVSQIYKGPFINDVSHQGGWGESANFRFSDKGEGGLYNFRFF